MSKNVQKGFWISQFENALPELDMPHDFAASNGCKSNKDEEMSAMGFVWKVFDDDFSEMIGRKAAGPEDRFALFLAAEMIMLGKYSNQEDVIIGTTAAETGSGGVLNLLALRGKPEKRKTFDEFLTEVREYCRKAFENRDYPYGELIRELTEHNYLKRGSLFQVMLLPEEADSRADEDAIKEAGTIPELLFALQKDGLCLHYRKSLYGEASATRILEHLECIVRQGVQDGGILIDNMEMLSAGEYERIVKGFNRREKRVYKQTLIEMFERQVENGPERPAVVCGGRTLTYDEFNRKINNVAHRLRKMGIKQNDVVALLTHRSFEMLIGIFAVMKSGAAFLPIDPMYPEERIRFVLADSAPKALLKYMVQIDTDVPSVDLSDEEVWKEPAENPEHVKCMDDLFYILYTSGTTGNPKGAMITEEAAVNAALGTCGAEGNMFDRTLLATNYAFVLSLYEYMTFIRGGCGFLIGNEDKQDTKKCAAFIKENKINTMVSTASYFDTLATQYKEVLIGNLEHVFLGGEKFKVPGALLGDESAGDMIMYNLYGQTETCEIAIYRKKVRELKNEKRQYIGFPVGNIEAYIMNGDKLCGIGVPGELCVVHEGAAGYLNLPQLNEEKYVKNPFGEGKMYRTGDRAKWCENGVIEILGRMDDLVKIRGFRIELGEIENRIRQLDRIQNCAVTARPDAGGDMAIHAYLVGEGKLNMAAVKKELSKTLPVYMIPPYMMQIPEIPMTKNGKLDYRALPEIRQQKKGKYIAPGNELEKQICECYEEILGAEKVGIRDSFFELGGHSLRAARLQNLLEEKTGVRISLSDVFLNPTPEKLAELISRENSKEYTPIPKAQEKEYYPMSPAQKRIYLSCRMEEGGILYNIPQAFRIRGAVDVEALRRAFGKMIERHEILRTEFILMGMNLVQRIREHAEEDFTVLRDEEKSEEQLIREFVRPFQLASAPLVRACLVDRGEEWLLLVDMHHIVSDGMSFGTFMKELLALYNGVTLEPLKRQFKDYSEWMQNRDLSAQRNYWVEQFEGDIPVLDMPMDYARPKVQSHEGAVVFRKTGKTLGRKMRKMAAKADATPYMVLLSSAMVLLSKYSGQEDIVIGSPAGGRIHRDTEGMLGMFVNTLAMRGKPEGKKNFAEFLREMRESCLRAYENQEYPFEELVEAVKVKRDFSRNPIFDVLLVLQNNERVHTYMDGAEISEVRIRETAVKFDLAFNISEEDDNFTIGLEYCTDLYEKASAEKLLKCFTSILEQVAEQPQLKIEEIEAVR